MALSVLQFGVLTIIVLRMVKADQCPPSCTQNLPLFDSQRENSNTLENGIQAIVPEYQFSCHGNVTEWQTYIYPLVSGRRHTIEFRVWRELATDGVNSTEPSYALTGSNVFQDVRARRGFLELAVETENQIQVQPGDVVGFSFNSSSAEIQLDMENSDVRVLQYDSNDLRANRLFLTGLQDSVLLGAPAMTAIVVPSLPQNPVLTPLSTSPQQPTPTSVSSATLQRSPQSCASLVSESTGGASPSPEVENENTDDFDQSPPYLTITAAIGGTVLVIAIGLAAGTITAVHVIRRRRKAIRNTDSSDADMTENPVYSNHWNIPTGPNAAYGMTSVQCTGARKSEAGSGITRNVVQPLQSEASDHESCQIILSPPEHYYEPMELTNNSQRSENEYITTLGQ